MSGPTKVKTPPDQGGAFRKSECDNRHNTDDSGACSYFITHPPQRLPSGPIARLLDQALAKADACDTEADILERRARQLRRLKAQHLDVARGLLQQCEEAG